MLHLKSMSVETFDKFKTESQSAYATQLAIVEGIPFEEALQHAREQFEKLASDGMMTEGQSFFDVVESRTGEPIGFLWLGVQIRFGRKIASINDITIAPPYRGKGFGKALMKTVEEEARKLAAVRIRLHVFNQNEIAKQLYLSMGYLATNLDLRKDL